MRFLPVKALGYCAGIGLSLAGSFLWPLFIGAGGAFLAVFFRRSLLAVLFLGLALGAIRYQLDNMLDAAPWGPGDHVALPAVVEEVVSHHTWTQYRLRVPGLGRSILARGSGVYPVEEGNRVAVRGTILPLPDAGNPGQFDYGLYLKGRGVGWTLRLDPGSLQVTGGGRTLAGRARALLRDALTRGLPGDVEGLYLGLILGERASVDADLTGDLSKAGLGHLLAVSGLHVGFITAASMALGKMLNLGAGKAGILAGAVTVCYCLLVGAKPSVLRATIMALCYLAFGSGKYDGFTGLALASLVILTWRPLALLESGFHLSFAATWGILHLMPTIERALGSLPGYIKAVLSVTISAQLAVTPLVLRYFGFVSTVSLLANPLLVPVAAFMVLYGLFLAVAGVFLPVPVFMSWPAVFAARILAEGAGLLGNLPGATASGPLPSWAATGCWFLALGCLPKRRKAAVLLGASSFLLLLIPGAIRQYDGNLRVTVLDVGQGDAIVVMAPGGPTLLVDGGVRGPDGTRDMGANVVLPYLRHRHVHRLDGVFVTHAHWDHVGGLFAVVEGIPVDHVFIPEAQRHEGPMEDLADVASSKGVPVTFLSVGDSLRYQGVLVEVLHPPTEPLALWCLNESSLTLRVSLERVSFLLTGDLEAAGEDYLVGRAHLESDVLKVGHHGSRYGTGEPFLSAVNPGHAVISYGPNSFGHPHSETLERLHESGITVWRTGTSGAVKFVTDGAGVEVTTFRGSRNLPKGLPGLMTRMIQLAAAFFLG